jgi:hypothetical protein
LLLTAVGFGPDVSLCVAFRSGVAVALGVAVAVVVVVGVCAGVALRATVGLALRSVVAVAVAADCGEGLAFGSTLGLAQTAACRAGVGVLSSPATAVALTPVVSTATSALLLLPPKPAKATRDKTSNGKSAPTTIGRRRRINDM